MSTDTFVRSFEIAELAEGDGRTIEARLIPYNTPATVADPPDFVPYKEMFLPGAFEPQTRAANRVLLNFEHEQGIGGVVGRGLELRDSSSELWGAFRALDTQDADKALELAREGVLGGISIEFRALRSRTVGGVVQRIRAQLDKVSLCRFPAYQNAAVLAVRQETARDDADDEQEEREPVEVPPLLPPSADKLARFGVEAPAWAVRKES